MVLPMVELEMVGVVRVVGLPMVELEMVGGVRVVGLPAVWPCQLGLLPFGPSFLHLRSAVPLISTV
jgi:hypothetical protein